MMMNSPYSTTGFRYFVMGGSGMIISMILLVFIIYAVTRLSKISDKTSESWFGGKIL
ncbi:MAG: hypothetical protein ABRQ27_16685 [Clostridiaceae bacterium]